MRPAPDPPLSAAIPSSSGPAEPVQRHRSSLDLTRGPLLVLTLVVVAFAVHLPMLSQRVWNSDEAYAATQAQVLDHGGRLYVDTVDRKPPAVPYLYAAVFTVTGSDDLVPVRVLAILADVVTALLLAAEARRRFHRDRAGLIAGLLFLGASGAFYATDFQAANFETFMLPTMVAGFALAARRRPLASGIAIGVSTLTKQTAAATLLPAVWLLGQVRTRRLRGVALLAAGFAAPILLAAALFGAHDFFRWVFTGDTGYLDTGGAVGYSVHLGLRQTLWFVLGNIAVVSLAVLAARRFRDHLDLWLWTAAGVVAVVSGFRFFGHYYLQLLPPLALLATGPIVNASKRTLAVVAIVVAVPAGFFAQKALSSRLSRTEVVARDLTAYVRRAVPPSGRILIWGHLPEVYWQSGRAPATRFATTGFLTGQSGGRPPNLTGMSLAAPGAWTDFEADLRAHPPALILDLAPADVRNARYESQARFPRFSHYLHLHYRPNGRVDGVVAYVPR
ncbi:MAG TPA: glycosyltransferase family 39 protein [Acidimicrobiia bacterium]|nr:glycosyltransferase family 39 protein [Acidimicrobiia bacterium]